MNKIWKQALVCLLWVLPLISAFLYIFFNITWWAPTNGNQGREFLIFMLHVLSLGGGFVWYACAYLEGPKK